MGEDMKNNLLNKRELLEFLSEMLSEIFEEQGQIRGKIQEYNERIKKINQKIAELSTHTSFGDMLISPLTSEEENEKNEYLNQVGDLQTRIFDLQDRMVRIQERIEKIKNLGGLVDKQLVGETTEESTFEKIRSLEIQEEERKRISREIHDTTVQNLTTLVYKTEFCTKLMDRDINRAKLEMQGMKDTLRKTIDELRVIIYQLRPMSIDDIGLIATLQRIAKQNNTENKSLIMIINVVNKEIQTMSVINITLFRVIQEAFLNTMKYANATQFIITIVYEDNHIRIIIQDNGVGFDMDELDSKRKKHFGLSIMKERIEALSGVLEIYSEINKGTEIKIEVPILQVQHGG